MRPLSRPAKTRTVSRLCTRCALSAANSPSSLLLAPQHRKALHQAVLAEILEERVVSSRGRQIPRGVKRKMSNFPLRPRRCASNKRIDFVECIRILQ